MTLVALALAAVAVGELGLRATGYGAPLLYVADADYEYALAPMQDTHRWGMRLRTNRFGMRSPDFDPQDVVGRRVLVLGDSVAAGGNWTDQDKLATTLLAAEHRFVMNASVGGWGPGNQLAFVRKHGVFGATDVIVVWSSDDLTDDRTFGPLNRYETPVERPRFALARFVDQYLLGGPRRARAESAAPGVEGDARASMAVLLAVLKTEGVRVCVLEHVLRDTSEAEQTTLTDLAQSHGVRFVSARALYRAAEHVGASLYRDGIHLNDTGQAALADAMETCLIP